MFSITLLVFVVIAVNGQRSTSDHLTNPHKADGPRPYSFNYRSILKNGEGESSRSESADGSGKVQGSYSLNNDKGHYRVVEYVADQDGFRAVIRTNEPGTKNKNSANVIMHSESGLIHYNPINPPVFSNTQPAADDPISPAAKPATVSQPVRVPSRRPTYRRPAVYSGRNPRLNIPSISGLDQNVPIHGRLILNSATESVVPKLEPADVSTNNLIPIAPIL